METQAHYWWQKGKDEWMEDGVISTDTMFFLSTFFGIEPDEIIEHYETEIDSDWDDFTDDEDYYDE